MDKEIQQNRKDLWQLARRLKSFTYQQIFKEFKKGRKSLQVDTRQTVRDYLEELSSVGCIRRQNDYYFF